MLSLYQVRSVVVAIMLAFSSLALTVNQAHANDALTDSKDQHSQSQKESMQSANAERNGVFQNASKTNSVSSSRGIIRSNRANQKGTDSGYEYRTYQGHNNNLSQTQMGKAHSDLARWMPTDYADQISIPKGDNLPSARAISNAVFDQPYSRPNAQNASDYLWQWGQFLDHDISLSDGMDPPEPMPIAVPMGDIYFDPNQTGQMTIAFNRSIYNTDTGDSIQNPRQQINEISSWIDASNVYGSTEFRALALRTLDDYGTLKTSTGNLLPFNVDQLPNAGGDGTHLYVAGDVRANEQVGLTALHTLFVREHNRLAAQILSDSPGLSGEEIYQQARRLVGGIMQHITYNEFLPVLLGPNALPVYQGYNPQQDSAISAVFSTAAYRFGHSSLSPVIRRITENGETHINGDLELRDAFFSPQTLAEPESLEAILRGLSMQVCQSIDAFVIDDLRNFLFGPPGAGGLDLVSLNIQRGRDHGLYSYADLRQALNLDPVVSFDQISSDGAVQNNLQNAYNGQIEDIEAWVGGLAEDHVPGALVGELLYTMLRKQFVLLRDGDRFWYQNSLTADEQAFVESSTLANVIRRNTEVEQNLADNVFIVENLNDSDGDSIEDIRDNCTAVANSNQTDSDNDGFGNLCDTDLNNDGNTNFADLAVFVNSYLTTDPHSDFNVDGIVNGLDLAIFRDYFLQIVGPSGLHD